MEKKLNSSKFEYRLQYILKTAPAGCDFCMSDFFLSFNVFEKSDSYDKWLPWFGPNDIHFIVYKDWITDATIEVNNDAISIMYSLFQYIELLSQDKCTEAIDFVLDTMTYSIKLLEDAENNFALSL